MNINKLADEFLKLSEDTNPPLSLFKKINNSKNHYLALQDMSKKEIELAQMLRAQKFLDYIPDNYGVSMESYYARKKYSPTTRKIPERFVLTDRGMRALQTFEFDTLRDEDLSIYKKKKRVEEPRIRVEPEEAREIAREEDDFEEPTLKKKVLDHKTKTP